MLNHFSLVQQYQSRGLVKASGKSSFTTFVDLGMYQSPGGTGDNMSLSSESAAWLEVTKQPSPFQNVILHKQHSSEKH